MHAFAIDGWEPIISYHRHCDQFLARHVRVESGGELVEVEQYFHRYVVEMLLDERFDMALDIEPLVFEQAVRTLPDEEALLAWVASRMKPMDDHEKSDFNAKLERLGMDYPRMRPYFVRTLHEVDPARTDVTTTMRLVDLYEGRI